MILGMKSVLIRLGLSLACFFCGCLYSVSFGEKIEKDWRYQAIGPTENLPAVLQRGLEPGSDFEDVPQPKAGDWLAENKETGQTFEEFLKAKPLRPDSVRKKIYLQPMGVWTEDRGPDLTDLKEYLEAFFSLEAAVLPNWLPEKKAFAQRYNPFTQKPQIYVHDVLGRLSQHHLPEDAFCLVGITLEDFYPDPPWDFVFGMTLPGRRVSVVSFARYDPAFFGQQRPSDYRRVLLRRSCNVLVHEIAHIFGLKHCIYYRCILNGSNHLREADERPMHLCPICLRKLQFSIEFDIVEYYHNLLSFYEKVGFEDESKWVEGRLKKVLGDGKET